MNQWMEAVRKPVSRWLRGVVGVSLLSTAVLVGGSSVELWLWAANAQTRPAAVSRGYTLLQQGLVNDAIATFQAALRQSPNDREARLGLAIAYQRAGQDENAWNTYQQVLRQDPDNLAALTALGVLGGYRPEWQATGIDALTTLLRLDPDDTDARRQRALLLRYQGRFAESIADYEFLLGESSDPDLLLGVAQSYAYSGAYQQSLTQFERYRAIARIPEDAVVAYALALRETGQLEQAIDVLESRLQQRSELDALTIELRSALAVAYVTNQQPDEAIATLAPLQNRPDSVLALARSLSEIARQTDNQDLYDEAVSLYRQVLTQTNAPSDGFLREVADVYRESPTAQADALRLYEQLLDRQPDNQSLLVKRLLLDYELGNLSRSALVSSLQDIGRSLSSNVADQRAIALALIPFDPPDPAVLPFYQRLLEADIDVPFLYYRIAQMYLQQSNYSAARQAVADYEANTYETPNYAAALLQADIERQSGNFDTSANQYQALIAGNPPRPILNNAQRGLAGVRTAQGQLQSALAIYETLVAQNPGDLEFELGRASLAYRLGTMTEAQAEGVLDDWLATQPSTAIPSELYNLVGTLPASPEREALYQRLLNADPNSIPVNLRLIQVLASRDPDAAQARVDELIAQNPNDINVYFVQGELAQQLDDLDQASAAYETILERNPDNPDALSALGGVRFQQENYAAAARLYARVLELKPDDWETRRILAELNAAQGRPLAALQQMRQIQSEQDEQGIRDMALEARIDELQVNLLRRRGFQPTWERY